MQELLTNPISRRKALQWSAGVVAAGVLGRTVLGEEPGGVPNVDERIRGEAERAELSMIFRGETEEQAMKWQAEFGLRLAQQLGPHAPPREWTAEVEDIVELEDHRREQLVLRADGHASLPVYLLTPKEEAKRRRPAVLCLHGHGAHGYHPIVGRDDLPGVGQAIAGANYDYGRQLVRRGYVVAAPCMTPFGRRLGDRDGYGKDDPCAVTFVRLQLLGKVLMAENLRDCLWAFEMLARHKQVDAERMGCVGLSYGGRMTMLTAAVEPRVKVAVPSGSLNVMQERVAVRYSCGAQVIPGLLRFGDVPEIGGLIAPRHCVWETGSKDGLIKPDWAEKALVRMRRVYRAFGVEDRLLVDRFEGGHRWNGAVAFPLLEKLLRPDA